MQTTLVYINPLAARLANRNPVQSDLINTLGRHYTVFRMLDPMSAPDSLTESKVAGCPHFSHGVSYAQLEQVKEDGGTFVNAMMEGLLYDIDLWTDLIDLKKHSATAAIYVGIPYESYKAAAGELAVPQEVYDNAEFTTKSIVQLLNENKSTTLH